MSDDRFSGISTGFNEATGQNEWEAVKKFFSQFFGKKEEGPVAEEGSKKKGLAEEIADFSRMVQYPESSSADWDNVYQDWMDGVIDIEEMSDGQLKSIYDELRGYEGQEPETMIEELTQFRDRIYSR